jgi:hypothetical protein
MIFGEAVETFCCYDTDQFPDYSKVVMEYMDPVKKAKRCEAGILGNYTLKIA